MNETNRSGVMNSTNAIDSTNAINPTDAINPTNAMDAKNAMDPTNAIDAKNAMNSTDAINPPNAMDAKNATNAMNASNATNANDAKLWYVVQTKPVNEERVRSNLANQEIENFLPLIGVHQYSHGKLAQRIKPLFPNYLFALVDLGLHYYKVKYTRGVSKILGNGGGPIPISEKVIEVIKDQIGEDDLVKLEDDLKEGDLVQVTSGPLKEMVGIFQKKMTTKGRIKILLSLIGVDVPVQISRWQIKKVASVVIALLSYWVIELLG